MEILHQNEDFAVCVKPVGVDSQQGMCALLQDRLGGQFYPLHRLDQNVGGVMVYARSQKVAAHLSGVIARQEMVKEYVARVWGTPPEKATWEDYLFKDSSKNKVFVVKKLRKGVKSAKLSFVRLTGGEESLVHIRLYTGRSHQIRVQFASRGFPLLGDGKYGREKDNRQYGRSYQALYSYKLRFEFTTDAGCLSGLNGREWTVQDVDFVKEYFPDFSMSDPG